MKIVRYIILTLVLYTCVILFCCIGVKVKHCTFASEDNEEIVISGNFFNAFHDIVSQTQCNINIKRIIYVLSADDILVDKQEMLSDDDYVGYLIRGNFAFLSWQDWKFLIKNNPWVTIREVIAAPFYMFRIPSYTKSKEYNSGIVSSEYLYSIINYCNDNGIRLQAVVMPNPGKINTEDVEECVGLMQYYVGGVHDYSDMYVPSKYISNRKLTKMGKDKVLKAITANILGIHSQEYIELNKVENIKKESPILRMIERADKVVFVGNSITEGCDNGGYGWYESLMVTYPDVKVGKIAYGGITTEGLLGKMKEIVAEKGDLYVFASGCNDIKIGDPIDGAANYVCNLQKFVDELRRVNPDVQFVFIAPWQRWPETELESLARPEYIKSLGMWCKANGHVFVNPNPYIDYYIKKSKYFDYYMVDRTHPNSGHGIKLYSEAVVNCALN